MTGKIEDPKRRARILSIHAENLKCVRLLDIDEIGDWTEIRGDSGQGKTTVLDAIYAGIYGMDKSMIRRGADSTTIMLDLSVAKLKRTVYLDPKKADALKVTDASGFGITQAMTFLKSIVSPTIFKPLEFVRLGAGEDAGKTKRLRQQRDMLLEVTPLTLTYAGIEKRIEKISDGALAAFRAVYPSPDKINLSGHGIDVCKALEKTFYDTRRGVNDRASELEGALKNTPKPTSPAFDGTATAAKANELAAQQAYWKAHGEAGARAEKIARVESLRAEVAFTEASLAPRDSISDAVSDAKNAIAARTATIQGVERQIAELQSQLTKHRAELDRERGELRVAEDAIREHELLDRKRAELAAAEAAIGSEDTNNLESLQAAYENAKSLREAREQQDRYDAALKAANAAREKAVALDALVEFFRDTLPKAIISGMKFPVDGLGIEDDVVTYKGIPLHQLGTSEQTYVAALIAVALTPESEFVLIDGAESMGRKDRLALRQVQEEKGVQFILTIVDPDAIPGPGVVVMKDGEQVK